MNENPATVPTTVPPGAVGLMHAWKPVDRVVRSASVWLWVGVGYLVLDALAQVAIAATGPHVSLVRTGDTSLSGEWVDRETRLPLDDDVPLFSVADHVEIIVGFAGLLLYIAVIVLVIKVLFRLHDNARWYGIQRLRRGRAWIGWGWFVPVVNFWFPLQVVTDLRDAYRSGDRAPGTGWWWATLLIGMLAPAVVGLVSGVVGHASSEWTGVVGAAISAPVLIVSIVLMNRLLRWLRIQHDEQLHVWQMSQTTPRDAAPESSA